MASISTMYTVILIGQLQEEEGKKPQKTPTGTQLSWSRSSWKANRLGDGRTARGEAGRGLARSTETSGREWELYIMAR